MSSLSKPSLVFSKDKCSFNIVDDPCSLISFSISLNIGIAMLLVIWVSFMKVVLSLVGLTIVFRGIYAYCFEVFMNELTKTQITVVQLLSDGKTVSEIADYRFRSLGTIRKHVEQAKQRTGAKTIGHLVKIALLQGVIHSVFLCLIMQQVSTQDIRTFTNRRGRTVRTVATLSSRRLIMNVV